MHKLLEEVMQMTGESKSEAVGRLLDERRQRLSMRQLNPKDEAHFLAFLQDELWAQIPEALLGTTLTKEAEENILGYGGSGLLSTIWFAVVSAMNGGTN